MAKSRGRKLADIIVSAGVDIDGNLTFDGGSTSDDLTFADNDKANFGDASDLQIYHDGSSNLIQGSNGSLYIQAKAGENSILATPDGGVNVYHDNSLKFETTSTGATVTGTLVADGLTMGDNELIQLGTGNDLRIYHDGSHSRILENGTGNLIIQGTNLDLADTATGETFLRAVSNDSVEIYYDGSKKFETTSTGATVTGTLVANSVNLGDSEAINIGASDDFQLYHDGSNSYIYDAGTGYMVLMSNGPGIRLNKNNAEVMLDATPDGAVSLYYDNSKKFETLSGGAKVTGQLTATSDFIAADSGGTARGYLFGTSGGLFLRYNSGSNLQIQEAGSTRVTFDTGGSVGINESSPDALLHITGQNTAGLIVENSAGIAETTPYVSMAATNYSASTGTFRFEDLRTNQGSPSFVWNVARDDTSVLAYNFQTGDTSRISVTQSGNVGINVASPSSALDVRGPGTGGGQKNTIAFGTSGWGNPTATNAALDGGVKLALFEGTTQKVQIGMDGNARLWFSSTGTGTEGIDFYTGSTNTDAPSNRMRITKAGNIGISTGSPDEKLHVTGGGIKVDGEPTIATNSGAGLFFGYGSNVAKITALDQGVAWKNLRLNAAEHEFYIAGGQQAKLDSSGNLLLGAATANDSSSSMGGQTPDLYVPGYTSLGSLRINGADTGNTIYKTGGAFGLTLGDSNMITLSNSDSTARLSAGNWEVLSGGQLRAYRGGNSAYGALYMDTGENLYIYNSWGAKSIVLDRDGNLGLGTNDPGVILDIQTPGNTADGTYYSTVTINNTGTSTFSGIRFDRSDVAKWRVGLKPNDTFHISNLFTDGSSSNPNDNAFVIRNNNYIGMGVETPLTDLHIKNATGSATLLIQSGSNTSSASVLFGDSIDTSRGEIEYTSTDDMVFKTNNLDEKMRIRYTGDVGIGTSGATIAAKLDVQMPDSGNTDAQLIQQWQHQGQNTLQLNMYGGATDLIQFAAYNGEQNIAIVTEALASLSATTAKGIYIKSGGNVGIGTTSPATKLDVNGNATFRGSSSDQSSATDSTSVPSTTGTAVVRWNGGYTDGRYSTEFVKVDRIGNLPLYVRESSGTANSFSNVARFGAHANTGDSTRTNKFYVFGNMGAAGDATVTGNIQAGTASVNGNRFNMKVVGYDAGTAYDVAMHTHYDSVYGRAGQIITNNAWLELNAAQSNGNIIMHVGDGKYGFNTDSPTVKYDLTSTNSFGLPGTSGTTPVGFARIGYTDRTWGGNEILMGIINAGAQDYAGYIQCKVPTNYALNRAFLLNPQGGRVGIGTDTPNTTLEVANAAGAGNGSAQEVGRFVNTASGATSMYLYLGASSGTDWRVGKNVTGISGNANFSISDHSGNRKLDLTADAALGLGTATPITPVHKATTLTASQSTGNSWSTSNDTANFSSRGAIEVGGITNRYIIVSGLSGNFSANTWYPIMKRSELTAAAGNNSSLINGGFGMYFRIYMYTSSVGIGEYFTNRVTEMIWVQAAGSNSTQAHEMRVGAGFGHAPNAGHDADDPASCPIRMRIAHHLGSDSTWGNDQTIEIRFSQAITGADPAVAGKQVLVYGYMI